MSTLPLYLRHQELAALIKPLTDAGLLQAQDVMPVDTVAARFGEADPAVLLAMALAMRAPRAGHVGADLKQAPLLTQDSQDETGVVFTWPDFASWQARVQQSGLVDPSTNLEGIRPFVLQKLSDGRELLMARRLWQAQAQLAEQLLAMAASSPTLLLTGAQITAGLDRLKLTDPQTRAGVELAARQRLAIITGGPGTGKTYSIKCLLPVLLEHAVSLGQALDVRLAAPTGKAAVRMQEGIAQDLETLATTDSVRSFIQGLVPQTLHKLLGMRPDGSARHNRTNPLTCDVIVVDEVSMVDLRLMLRLLDAVPVGARLILLGDRDQLASVEAGTVLADLLQGAEKAEGTGSPLSGCVERYTVSRRFASAPTVAVIAADLQHGGPAESKHALALLTGEAAVARETLPDRVRWLDRELLTAKDAEKPKHGAGKPALPAGALSLLVAPYLQPQDGVAPAGYVAQLQAALQNGKGKPGFWSDPLLRGQLLDALDQYRVLAVHRKGPRGVAGLDQAMGKVIREALGKTWREFYAGELPTELGSWLGQPVLVTENSYEVGLMNGDIGLVLPTGQNRRLQAVFRDTRPGMPPLRSVPLARLPPHQGALVLTVHKSQGSQFPHVALVLADRDSPIQTRELVYTGITRAQQRFSWLGSREVLAGALVARVQRASGLAELLVG